MVSKREEEFTGELFSKICMLLFHSEASGYALLMISAPRNGGIQGDIAPNGIDNPAETIPSELQDICC